MKHLILASCVALAACGSVPPVPKTPVQAVYELETIELAAMRIAVAYVQLPACGTGPVICSTTTNKAAIKLAVDREYPLITLVMKIARSVNPDKTEFENALVAAATAVGDLSNLSKTLKVQ